MIGRDAAVALRLTLVLTLIAGAAYPTLLYGLAHAVLPWRAETSLVVDRCGVVIGSALIGQQFTGARWFHGRPSAVGYDGAGSGGSNLGPTNPALADSLQARAVRFRTDNYLDPRSLLPPDAVTSSGSGLDPDVSVATAELQVRRVAGARLIDSAVVGAIVQAHERAAWPGSGSGRVNVLALNLALDSLIASADGCPALRR